MRFINDDQIPPLLPNALSYIILFSIIKRSDYERFPLPEIDELLLVVSGVNDLERLAKEAHQFVLPLDGQRGGHHDEAAFDGFAKLQFFDQQPAMIVLPAPGSSASRKASAAAGAS